MRPIEEAVSLPLAFVQPRAMERTWELRAGGEPAGALEFRSAFGSLAFARAAGSSWTFKRVGFFATRATARPEGSPEDAVVYTPRWSGQEGEVVLAGGERLRFGTANFWGTRFALGDAGGRAIATLGPEPEIHRLSDLFRTQALVVVDPSAAARPDLALLLLFAWYLVVLHHEDATATAVLVT